MQWEHGAHRGAADAANQAPPRAGIDEFSANAALVDGVRRFGASWASGELAAVGRLVGSEQFVENARLANVHPPLLHALDRYGGRRDEVEYHPAYHHVLAAAVAHGADTAAWADPRPGAHVARAAAFMLFAQVEPGHACPVSMTHAAVPALSRQPDVARLWLPASTATATSPASSRPPASRERSWGWR
ncbi:hypothetical protein [Sinomonas atrocyanea]